MFHYLTSDSIQTLCNHGLAWSGDYPNQVMTKQPINSLFHVSCNMTENQKKIKKPKKKRTGVLDTDKNTNLPSRQWSQTSWPISAIFFDSCHENPYFYIKFMWQSCQSTVALLDANYKTPPLCIYLW